MRDDVSVREEVCVARVEWSVEYGMRESEAMYSYTREKGVSLIFGDKVNIRYILGRLYFKSLGRSSSHAQFMTYLLCASLAGIKAAKSQNCIIDRARHLSPLNNYMWRGAPLVTPKYPCMVAQGCVGSDHLNISISSLY